MAKGWKRARVTGRRFLTATLAVLWLVPVGPLQARSAEDEILRLMDEFSERLFPDSASVEPCAERRSVGIWPFESGKQPISEAAADRVYIDLVAALVGAAPACIDVLDGTGIGAILMHLQRTGALQEAAGNPIAALEEANRAVDIVILPRLFIQNGRVMLSLKAVERGSGRTLAQSPARILPEALVTVAAADRAQDLDAAVESAVALFHAQAREMSRVMPTGLRYQDSGVQTPFARYFFGRAMAALANRWADSLTDSALAVVDPDLDLAAGLGLPAGAGDLDPLARLAEADGDEGLFELSGTYWVIDDTLDITLSLRGATGKRAVWQGRLAMSETGGLAVVPENPAIEVHAEEQGSFALQMTSARGEDPVYHAGEELRVYLRAGRAAWLYCYYVDASGGVTQVLPNPFQSDAADGHRLEPDIVHALPDPERDPFRFLLNEDTIGEEMLKCFAMARNVDADLPGVLRARDLSPLPPEAAEEIEATFRAFTDTALAEAALTLTILPAEAAQEP